VLSRGCLKRLVAQKKSFSINKAAYRAHEHFIINKFKIGETPFSMPTRVCIFKTFEEREKVKH